MQKERKKKVQCRICENVLTRGALKRHMKTQHNETQDDYICEKVETTGTYFLNFKKGKRNQCPVKGCCGGGSDKFGIYRHFCTRHPKAKIIVEQDGELNRCELCGMFTADVQKHQKSKTCEKLRGRRKHEKLLAEQQKADGVSFTVYGKRLERVREFKYLGRIIDEGDCDSNCIRKQVQKARRQWNCIAKILKREGANSVTMAKFYMAIVQAVLLYGADSWVITTRDWKYLESFHNRSLRYMTGQHIRKAGEEWSYPNHTLLEAKCKLFPIQTYVQRRRGTLWKYLKEYRKELVEEMENATVPPGNVNKVLWWNQPYITKEDLQEMKNFWFK